ncbi:unnamed protein product [Blepharisma stoltei]|uniref:RWD domain-containing protein n=1 Tax=Blepharisma stoltei TaxID=1481888 RepID=A0AAU9IEM4_9CILI|nr:unnamed protein product [Blepharisma stoltei]
MNAEQLEELEALQFMLMEGEFVRQDGNLLELQIPIPQLETRPFISFEIIWPENYPTNPLIFTISDNRLSQNTKDDLTQKIAKIAEENAGGPATFNVYVSLKDNLDNWGIVDELLNPVIDEYEEEFVSKPKQSGLSKSQKRKQYKFMNANGELQRGHDWVDIISHLSKK